MQQTAHILVLHKILFVFGVQYFREKLESILPLLALFSVATEAVFEFYPCRFVADLVALAAVIKLLRKSIW